MDESNESVRLVQQDVRRNKMVQEGILQPISAIHNPHVQKLTYVNPHLRFTNPTYDFSHGIPHGLPYMVATGDKKRHPNALVYCRPDNRRTGILSSQSGILLEDVPLPYLDEKGLGQLNEEFAYGSRIRHKYVRTSQSGTFFGTWGLADLNWVNRDANATDGLYEDGIRIVPTVAILEISQIPDENGNFISLKEAIERGLVASYTIPAIQFRAFVTPYRSKDLICVEAANLPEKEIIRRKNMLLMAFDDMPGDRTIPVDLSNGLQSVPEYLEWFSRTFGQNLARLHKKRKVHNWLHAMHNVTLDVRIVDSDGLGTDASDRDIKNERSSLFSQDKDCPSDLWKFYNSVVMLSRSTVNPDTFLTQTIEAYHRELNN